MDRLKLQLEVSQVVVNIIAPTEEGDDYAYGMQLAATRKRSLERV